MAISNDVNWRDMSRVRNPSRDTLGDVVAAADATFADGSYSPYGALVDNSGAEQMMKIDAFAGVAQVPPPLPLGQATVFDDLLGLPLNEDQITQVYGAVKSGAPIADVAITYGITQDQVSGIFTAMLNGSTPWDILNPVAATNMLTSSIPARTLGPDSANLMNSPQIYSMASAPQGTPVTSLPGVATSVFESIPLWAWGVGALVVIAMISKK